MHFRPVFVAWRPSFALLLDYRTFYQSKFDEHFLLFGSQLPESPFGVIRVPEQSLLHYPVDEVWLSVLMVFDSTNMTISITTVMIGAAYLEKLESNLLSRNQMIAEQIISEDRYQMSLSR